MTLQVNPSKTGAQNLFDLINATNPGKGFTIDNVSLGVVAVENTEPENSRVVVTALLNKGYSGTRNVYYNRLNPGTGHGKNSDMRVLISPTDNQTQIRDKIIAAVGCIGTDVDVVGNGAGGSFLIPVNEDDNSCTFTMTAKVASYVYVGVFNAYLTVPDVDVPLSEAIAINHLTGFVSA